jgi:hypothetical protein
MQMRKSKNKRRATILLIVVSLLALLFVIITGFLTLSRNERQTLQEFRRGDLTDRILDGQRNKAIDAMLNQITDAKGKVLSGPGAQYEDRLGGKYGFASADPMTSESVNMNPPPGSAEQQMDWFRPSGADGYGPNGRENVPVDYAAMKRFVYPQLSRLNPQAGDKPEPFPVWQLVLENELDVGQNARRLDANDIANAAREPSMDANGDGVPDSWLLYQIPSIEEANAMAGTPVQLSGYFSEDGIALNDFRPYSIPPSTPNNPLLDAMHNAYVRYRETARFDVATMVKSHGGMITLSAPRFRDPGNGVYTTPWNRLEEMRMFDSFRSPIDASLPGLANYPPADSNYVFDQLAGSSTAVELSLRRRGGLPPFGVGLGNQRRTHAVPGILSLLQGDPGSGGANWRGFPETLVPRYRVVLPRAQPARAENSERFNLAGNFAPNFGNDRYAAVRSSQVSATEMFEDDIQTGGLVSLASPLRSLAKRGSITLNNLSDELARKFKAGDSPPIPGTGTIPELSAAARNTPLTFGGQPGSSVNAASAGFTAPTYEGELKFWLGELAKAVRQMPDGRYRWVRFDQTTRKKVGDALIEHMARLIYDMLSQHGGWAGTGTNPEVVTRESQAIQLAVNIAQFMMPRSPVGSSMPGFVDTVTYEDGNSVLYVGYGPQPYISEVVACYKYDTNSQTESELGIAVEIFNPCDPHFVNVPAGSAGDPADFQGPPGTAAPFDVFALPADQFAITLDEFGPSDLASPTGPPLQLKGAILEGAIKRLNGRCFYTASFGIIGSGSGPTDVFNNTAGMNGILNPPLRIPAPRWYSHDPTQPHKMTVHLWKKGIFEDQAGGVNLSSNAIWYLVDKIELDLHRLLDLPDFTWDKYNFTSRARDTAPSREFGSFNFYTMPPIPNNPDNYAAIDGERDTFARWAVVLPPHETPDPPPASVPSRGTPTATLGNHRYYASPSSGGVINPDLPNVTARFSPTTPLILMNAGPDDTNRGAPLFERLNNLPMFGNRPAGGADARQGDLRPRSFPTPGFLLFVPRYCHTQPVNGGLNNRIPASERLLDEWKKHESGGAASPTYNITGTGGLPGYPADFGHMPIFSNSQPAIAGGYFYDNDEATRHPTVPPSPNPASPGKIPWGLLVFDYFTTLDPAAPGVDPLRVPGRINVNSAQWTTLSLLPVIGPALPNPTGADRIPLDAGHYILPILRNWIDTPSPFVPPGGVVDTFDPSPSFWDPVVGVLAGRGSTPESDLVLGLPQPLPPDTVPYNSRLIHTDPYSQPRATEWSGVELDPSTPTRWRLGKWLAASAAAYRDGIQYVAFNESLTTNRPGYMRFADAYLRNPAGTASGPGAGARFRPVQGGMAVSEFNDASGIRRYRENALYGEMRGAAVRDPVTTGIVGAVDRPSQFGFVSLGELLNAKGFDSTRYTWLPPYPAPTFTTTPTTLAKGDFVKAVSLLALMDTQMLTTRSNTFTAYVSVMDRKQAESSVRAEFIVDRSNVLPRLSYEYHRPPPNAGSALNLEPDRVKLVNLLDLNYNYVGPDNLPETPVRWTATPGMKPSVIAEKRIGYYNTRFDE